MVKLTSDKAGLSTSVPKTVIEIEPSSFKDVVATGPVAAGASLTAFTVIGTRTADVVSVELEDSLLVVKVNSKGSLPLKLASGVYV